MRSALPLPALLLTALLAAACSGSGSTTAPESPSSADPASAPPASASGTLTIYSGRSESLVGPLIDRFEASTGLDVQVNYAGTTDLAATILEEGDASPADVFFAQDAGALGAVGAEGRLTRPCRHPRRGGLPVRGRRRVVGRRVGSSPGRHLRHADPRARPISRRRSTPSRTRPGRVGSAGRRPTRRSSRSSRHTASSRATKRPRRGSKGSRRTSRRSTTATTRSSRP